MDIAIAMRYGGEPIRADECNETSYLTMGLLCPCESCKDLVRWVPSQERTSTKGKEFSVKSHFAHFKAKDPVLQALCEKRVNNLKKADLDKMARKAIQQRSSLFQRWFWEVLDAHIIRCDLTSEFNLRDLLFLRGEFSEYTPGKKLIKVINEYNQKYRGVAKKEAESFLNIMQIHKKFKLLSDGINNTAKQESLLDDPIGDFASLMHTLSSSRLHKQIVNEALDFLGAKRNYPFRLALIGWLYNVGNEHIQGYFELDSDSDQFGEKLYGIIGQLFAVIPWASEFEDLSKSNALTRRSLAGAVLMHILNSSQEKHSKQYDTKKPFICM